MTAQCLTGPLNMGHDVKRNRKMQVESEHSGRMQISAISSSGSVTFTPCQQGSSSWPEELVSVLLVSRLHLADTRCL